MLVVKYINPLVAFGSALLFLSHCNLKSNLRVGKLNPLLMTLALNLLMRTSVLKKRLNIIWIHYGLPFSLAVVHAVVNF